MASNALSMNLRGSGSSSRPRRRRRLRSPEPSEYEEDGVEILGTFESFEGELGQGIHENASCDGLLGHSGDTGNFEKGSCRDSFGEMEKSMGDSDLFSCPICMEPWSSDDTHRIWYKP
ncbi:hypothetical protein AMTR_s00032p00199880 [Amborella trichopoda]|uniref:Uncharacterized protein n=1 Tax=Amborella trichopoda TaxID=13333 RepID=U5CXQ7_AMBTC|nr:hypothetical protein AMTR_s00032p00199880 [Amborella trichopoda]